MKNKQRKFIRNILIAIISLFIVAFILNIAPGYKRDTMINKTNLVFNDENVTEQLKDDIYINENGSVYISKEDVITLLDNNLYYDEMNSQIITCSDTKVASIKLYEKQMIVNDSIIYLSEPIIKQNEKVYIPIAQMSLIYNIKVEYIPKTDIVIVDKLDKGLIIANVSEDTEIKFKPRALSKSIGKLTKGQRVSCFYTTSKGWREIRTEDRNIRIYKSK